MSTMTRQDLLAVTEVAKNKIIERLVTKYDVQMICDSSRDKILSSVQSMNLENQALMRQLSAQRDMSWRKVTALEEQILSLQKDIRALQTTLNQRLDKPKNLQLFDSYQ